MINIFQEKYSSLFTFYGDSIDCINSIMYSLNYFDDIISKEVRELVLEAIKQLFKYNIIHVTYWGIDNEIMINKVVTIEEAMSYIRNYWLKEYCYEDLVFSPTFDYKDWYVKKLKELNINVNTDWEWFDKEVIPMIEVWAKEQEGKNLNVNES